MSEEENTVAADLNDVMRIFVGGQKESGTPSICRRGQIPTRERDGEQMEALQGLLENMRQEARAGGRAVQNHWEGEFKLTKLSEKDNIEEYLMTFK